MMAGPDIKSEDELLKDAIKEIILGGKRDGGPGLSRLEKITCGAMVVFFILSVLSAILSSLTGGGVQWVALVFMVLSQISAFLFEAVTIGYMIRRLKSPFIMVAEAILDELPRDLAISKSLSRVSSVKLYHLVDRIDSGVRHLRARTGLLIGTLENIGIVPFSVTYAAIFIKIYNDYEKTLPGVVGWVMWSGVVLLAFLIFGLMATLIGHRMERCVVVLRTAIKWGEAASSASVPVQTGATGRP